MSINDAPYYFGQTTHMKRDHSENFFCDLCDKVCTTKIDLKRHQLTHKADSEKPYQCDQCDRGFVMNHQLKVSVLFNYSINQKIWFFPCCSKWIAGFKRFQYAPASISASMTSLCCLVLARVSAVLSLSITALTSAFDPQRMLTSPLFFSSVAFKLIDNIPKSV